MSTANKTHSKLGIAACIVAFAVWIYFATAVYLFFYAEGFTERINSIISPPSNRIADFRGLGAAIVFITVAFFIVPAAGHLLGIILGFIGLIRANNKRLFPILGLSLNFLPMAILLLLFIIGTLTSTK